MLWHYRERKNGQETRIGSRNRKTGMSYRKRICVFVCLLALGTCHSNGGCGEAARKLTLMVYMCGSNLESYGGVYGSASEDIMEMVHAEINTQQVSVLVMTGGSDVPEQSSFFSSSSARIIEIGKGAFRRIWESPEPVNFGTPETLRDFIRFGIENRPAEEYALIFWNHGGGPLEGVCWDENHRNQDGEMDHLTMSEFTSAIKQANIPGKFRWIGFDACLMASLEVAGNLTDYAEYMIASQETEPSFGWNYHFLQGIENDKNGAETGKRIIEAYFEGNENSYEKLTLSCIDLSYVPDVIKAMDDVFLALSQRMDNSQYLLLSGLRMSTASFGKSIRVSASSPTGYDLIDFRDMLLKLEQTEATENLLRLLDLAVVYNQSNEEGAYGLTVYHPYANTRGYQRKWQEEYEHLEFSPGYQAYVKAFGDILTGTALFKWLDLIPAAMPPENGRYPFEMQLTAEQAENMVSAQLLILRDLNSDELGENCVLTAACPAVLGPDHILRAEWDGKILYAETETNRFPISPFLSDDGKTLRVPCLYTQGTGGREGSRSDVVGYELDANDSSEYPTIKRTLVEDDATDTMTSRIAFSEDQYDMLYFWNMDQLLPTPEADQTLPPFVDWPENLNHIEAVSIPLPASWRFHSLEADPGQAYHAVFCITDSQQKSICSMPAAVPNPTIERWNPMSVSFHSDQISADLFVNAHTFIENPYLDLYWKIQNAGNHELTVSIQDLLINDHRMIGYAGSVKIAPGQSSVRSFKIAPYNLAFLERLDTLSGIMAVSDENDQRQEIPFQYDFSSCSLATFDRGDQILAEGEFDGLQMKLLNIEPYQSGGWEMDLYLENNRQDDFPRTRMMFNGVFLGTRVESVPAGKTRIIRIRESNAQGTAGKVVADGEKTSVLITVEEGILQALGMSELNEIIFAPDLSAMNSNMAAYSLVLKEPYALGTLSPKPADYFYSQMYLYPPTDLGVPREEKLPLLADSNAVQVKLRRAAALADNILAELQITNLSENWLEIQMERSVNGGEKFGGRIDTLPPKSTEICLVRLGVPDVSDQPVEKLDFCVSFNPLYDSRKTTILNSVSIYPPTGLFVNQEGGMWLNGESFTGSADYQEVDLFDWKRETDMGETAPVEKDLWLPDELAAIRTVLEIEPDSLKMDEVESYTVTVGKTTWDGFWQVFTFQYCNPTDSDRLKIPLPGFYVTICEHPEIALLTSLQQDDKNILRGDVRSQIILWPGGNEIHLDWMLEYDKKAGRVTVEPEEGVNNDFNLADLSGMTFYDYQIILDQDEDGRLPHLRDAEPRTDLDWFFNLPEILLEGKPVQLALRPITPDDQCAILISIQTRDGQQYSLPLIPYPLPQ